MKSESMSGSRSPGTSDPEPDGDAPAGADDTSAEPAELGSDGGTAVGSDAAAGSTEGPGESGAPGGDDGGGVRVCRLEDDDADALIDALAPGTARSILSAVHEEPRTASELADRVDTSVQNVRHHVSKLVDAELVEAADTRYSVKGREMTVYGPADDGVVVAVGGDERSSVLDSLRSLLGAAAVLAGASLLVQALFGAGAATLSGPDTAPRVGDAASATDAGGALLGVLPPGMAFLGGGLLVLATVLAADRLRGR